MRRRIFVIAGYYVLIVVGLFLILAGVGWYLTKQKQVRLGMARPDFPYFKYSQDELNKLYPQYPLENVKTTQTPEQTYAKFISALKAGDLDDLKGVFTERKEKLYFEALEKDKELNKLSEWVADYNYEIIKKTENVGMVIFEVKSEKKLEVVFIKNNQGHWQIDSL
jgi:hypothetical protein